MKNLMDKLTDIGASSGTINLAIKLLIFFMFIVGVGLVAVIIIQTIMGEQPSNGIIAILTSVVILVGSLITVSATTSHINGTAAQSAILATQSQDKNATQIAAIVEQVLRATLATQAQSDKTAASVAQVVAQTVATTSANSAKTTIETATALSDNTDATIQNTVATQKILEQSTPQEMQIHG